MSSTLVWDYLFIPQTITAVMSSNTTSHTRSFLRIKEHHSLHCQQTFHIFLLNDSSRTEYFINGQCLAFGEDRIPSTLHYIYSSCVFTSPLSQHLKANGDNTIESSHYLVLSERLAPSENFVWDMTILLPEKCRITVMYLSFR